MGIGDTEPAEEEIKNPEDRPRDFLKGLSREVRKSETYIAFFLMHFTRVDKFLKYASLFAVSRRASQFVNIMGVWQDVCLAIVRQKRLA